MAFDGITVAAITAQLREKLVGGRLYKIAQPEEDALLLTVRQPDGQFRVYLSASASLPLVYLTESNKPSPLTAPNFCMVLRKHLANGKILSVTQPGLERILRIEVEHLDEMGDLRRKTLILELMGKHSNLIFCDENDTIIDSIKHVSAALSSVREVLPGKTYFVPNTMDKVDLLTADKTLFVNRLTAQGLPVYKAIYTSFTGISPIIAQQLCFLANVDSDLQAEHLNPEQLDALVTQFVHLQTLIKGAHFSPCCVYQGKNALEYAAIPLSLYADENHTLVTQKADGTRMDISSLLENFYAQKNMQTRIRQKSADLRHITQLALERNVKKYDLQRKQLADTEKRETYRIYGELLNAYGYGVQPGSKSLTCVNYYDNQEITIPLDEQKTAMENAQKYFEKYNKLKRTFEALSELTEEVKSEIEHLQSILTSLDLAETEADLVEIREELTESGYLHRKGLQKGRLGKGGKPVSAKKEKVTSKPFHYISSDGYDIYVGKNNFQNDELTFRFANGGDWWFHAKKMPGSHVILRAKGLEEIPDRAFEEAARLAAYYSSGREQEKVEIDYVRKKEVKKPAGGKPGFVVYYTNYSMAISPDISMLCPAKE